MLNFYTRVCVPSSSRPQPFSERESHAVVASRSGNSCATSIALSLVAVTVSRWVMMSLEIDHVTPSGTPFYKLYCTVPPY
jgi:hypothetical protein